MTCDELRDFYELYALGALEAAERREIDEHLGRGCQACSLGLKRALGTNSIIATLVPDVAPPKRLRKRVLALVGMEKTGWGWITAWGAVTAGLLVAVLYLSVQERRLGHEVADARRQVQQSAASLARVQEAMAFLNQPDTLLLTTGRAVPLPKARVFLNKTRGVMLIAGNLPPAPSGKIYEMWVIPKGGAPKPAGLFNSDAGGNAIHILPGEVDVESTAVVAVTMEPEAGSQTPTMPILVSAGL